MTLAAAAQIVLGFPEYREPAQRLAYQAGLPYADVAIHRFPDGESRVRLPPRLPEQVVLCRSLDDPNRKLVELELAAATALQLGARRLTLIAPYLCYMRQDAAFRPGEAVSQRIVGDILARRFDTLITVDPHLHRVHELSDAVPVARAISLNASGPMAVFLAGRVDNPLLIGPDEESRQWVQAIATQQQLDYAVAHKQRSSDTEVYVTLPEGDYGQRNIVFVDDMVSTGHTIAAAVAQLLPYRPASVSLLVTHALFIEDALARLRAAGVDHIVSTDSILHATNQLRLADLLAAALTRHISDAE